MGKCAAQAKTSHITCKDTDPLCPVCVEDKETSYHLLGKCSAYMAVRYSIMGAYLMQPDELHKVRLTTVLQFIRATKELDIGLNLCLRAGQLW